MKVRLKNMYKVICKDLSNRVIKEVVIDSKEILKQYTIDNDLYYILWIYKKVNNEYILDKIQ